MKIYILHICQINTRQHNQDMQTYNFNDTKCQYSYQHGYQHQRAFSILETNYGYTRDEMYTRTQQLVQSALECGGSPFGGYVRDVLIPVIKLGIPLSKVDFKDIDFWFTCKEDASCFIEKAGLYCSETLRQTGDDRADEGRYPIKRISLMSSYKDQDFVLVDIVIANFFPVCDFSVNLLTWDGNNFKVNSPYQVEDALQQIKNGGFDPEYSGVRKVVKEKYYSLEDIIEQIVGNKPVEVCKSYADLASGKIFSGSDYVNYARIRHDIFGYKILANVYVWGLKKSDKQKDKVPVSNFECIKNAVDTLNKKDKEKLMKELMKDLIGMD